MCRRVEHVGPVGAGASMKLAINLPLMIYYQAMGEAYVLCRHLKLDPKWLMELMADTSGGPNVLKNRGPKIAEALAGGDAGAATFDVDSIRKDLATMVAEAGQGARACRWWRRRSPSSMRPPRTAGAARRGIAAGLLAAKSAGQGKR